ncbi:MAG: hypothetical protein WC343_04395 [Bacilli bacterium]|jgi:hypothetical protein
MYLIKHKTTNQYLQEWYLRDHFGHWGDTPKQFNKTTKDKVLAVLGDSVEVSYRKKVK